MSCSQCVMLSVNGMATHELGCPIAWKDYARECRWCGTSFTPENKGQLCCSESCACAYYGYANDGGV